jgi:CrcB protein
VTRADSGGQTEGAGHPHPLTGQILTAVALGGVIGSLARAGLAHLVHGGPPGFPWATFSVNVAGAAMIGFVAVVTDASRGRRPWLRPFLATGVLGGFTTFSTFAVDADRLLRDGATGTALVYLLATVAVGLAAVRLSARAGWAVVGAPVRDALPVPDEES